MADSSHRFRGRATPGSQAFAFGPGEWCLEIPAGPAGQYRLAQLDDYALLARRSFPWQPPAWLSLEARACAPTFPGTWGFGWWNDPFGFAFLQGAEAVRLPVLPNAAWFFFASPPNYLSLQDDLPAQGSLAATFAAPRWPSLASILGLPVLPLLFLPPALRWLRRVGRRFVRQSATQLSIDPTGWHTYRIDWLPDQVVFTVDATIALQTQVAPHGPLGLVLWVDNQFARLAPDGHLGFGTLAAKQPAWVELRNVQASTIGADWQRL